LKKILVTGSSGLVGSEVCEHFHSSGWQVHGIDGNQRREYFGPAGDTSWRSKQLRAKLENFFDYAGDIVDRQPTADLVARIEPDAIFHAAAQPSHDLAASIPHRDFEVNAVGTLNLLEAARQHCPEAPFVYMSSNKVYGDKPNTLNFRELDKRYVFADEEYSAGIAEDFPIDQSCHSLFGASKLSADILTQEYGRYFGMQTCCLRGGCLTGPSHSGVILHGFLSYLTYCVVNKQDYTIYGYGGKQVRDNLHSHDVATFAERFIDKPRCGEVYNLGGAYANSCSVLEAIEIAELAAGEKLNYTIEDTPRIGDHKCYYSHLGKVTEHYPGWEITVGLQGIIKQLVKAAQEKQKES